MGWAGGSTIFDKIIEAAQEAIPDPVARKKFYSTVIPAFEDADWDTENECMDQDPAFDDALLTLHPDWF